MDTKARPEATDRRRARALTPLPMPSFELSTLSDDVLLTSAEAATVLRKRPSTLQYWRCKAPDKLPWIRVGGTVRYSVGALRAYLAARAGA
jgi:hypothetical protein